MNAKKILIFYTVVVVAMALVVLATPDSVKLMGMNLRFPRMHKVLVHEKPATVDTALMKPERDLTGARDSLAFYHQRLMEGPQRFWLPDNDIRFFDDFFKAAENAQCEHRVVRVLHYGDSQIEMDRITLRLRENLQNAFGGGGPGMIPLRQLVPTYSFNQSATGSLTCLSSWGKGDGISRDKGGNYGPMLRSWRVSGSATLSMSSTRNHEAMERVKRFSRITVLFNNRGAEVNVDMRDRKGGGTFAESCQESGIHSIRWVMDSSTSSATMTVRGSADVYGIMVDDGYGVAVDNIAMRGVSGQQFATANQEQLKEAFAQMDVKLVMMQFGGNMMRYLNTDKAIENYCATLGKQIDLMHEACPDAVIVFIGPADMIDPHTNQSYKQLPMVVESLRIMANEHGAAYWSMYDAMEGWNSMLKWKSQGLANSDYIHFSTKGARVVGDYISDSFMKMYELYLLRQQLTEEQFMRLW